MSSSDKGCPANRIQEKLKNRSAVIGIFGLGYVGLPLAVEIAKAGYYTVGFDIDSEKIKKLNAGNNYIADVSSDDLNTVIKNGMLVATAMISDIHSADCVCICVPTPLDKYQRPDVSYITESAEALVPQMHKDMLIILESTTYPGTTNDLLKPILEKSGLVCGIDFNLAYSPERVDPGNKEYKTKNTPKVVGGITATCTETAALLYETVLDAPVYRVSSPATAEMVKILENTYRNINIGLVNELAILSNKMGINIWEVLEAAKTKPYGYQVFYPGPGLGGHCIPLDPYYLSWKAREYSFHTTMIESSMMINDKMADYCVERARKILNQFQKALNGAKVLVLGIAYKQDISDYRESPALRVIEALEKENTNIQFYDPYIPMYLYGGEKRIGEVALTAKLLESVDLVIITAAHSNVDYSLVQKHAKVIFDTKNAMKNIEKRINIELL